MMIGLYVVVAFALSQTAWGRHVYAVGDDAEAARLAGIRSASAAQRLRRRRRIFALAGWILIGRINAASPNAGVDANLDTITAVVIGGTSLFGGRGGSGAPCSAHSSSGCSATVSRSPGSTCSTRPSPSAS